MSKSQKDFDIDEWVDLCGKALSNMQVVSAGPTRSGQRLQTRVSFPWKGKWRTGYQTMSRTAVTSSVKLDFKSLLSGGLHVDTALVQSGYSRYDADYLFGEIYAALLENGCKDKTLHLRKEIMRVAREAVRIADDKLDKVESMKCREHIPRWLADALLHGISPQELHEMVDTAVVQSVLKS